MIPFNLPLCLGTEIKYIQEAITENHQIGGDGPFTKACSDWLCQNAQVPGAFLTSSGTAALEMTALLADIKPGDEVIMPAFTFVTTANAFALRGATIVFVDIRPDTLNIDETLIEAAITPRTKVIVPVHYGGIGCEMDAIMDLARRYQLLVVEDAAQGLMASYKNKALGSIGDLGCYSFHETKNYTMGEGGALLINRESLMERATIIRDKGTNRHDFLAGRVDKYSWVDLGSSYLPSELNAAHLYAQLEAAAMVNARRLSLWQHYFAQLTPLAAAGRIELPVVPEHCQHNGHLFYLKTASQLERDELIAWLKQDQISTVFHYTPLHETPGGQKFGRFHGADRFTTSESLRLLRLPLFYSLTEAQLATVVERITAFYQR
ncbi:dTDP-4-amino-4,6-dideoxygalactose transaminase [Acetobacterium wieringae]|uniref:dTDP-4-amino-4,6-dideoxygalactose transaminase n=1 Tax=Acetobacterium wieringae TaxID=52694 RepID=A0A1F2PHI6_9FIRM|nr:dTDP-4-amino-4,6-dideoxygalactose transaminase [Acetobacterium wieringae]OFV70434.1 dTDP-4-amino-4,6-dideoxygalactose transaminase [Acetobacterium wieringae]